MAAGTNRRNLRTDATRRHSLDRLSWWTRSGFRDFVHSSCPEQAAHKEPEDKAEIHKRSDKTQCPPPLATRQTN